MPLPIGASSHDDVQLDGRLPSFSSMLSSVH